MKTTRVVAIAALCFLPILVIAEDRPYSLGPVTSVSYIRVKPGQYDVSVSATGFGPVKRTLSVRPSGRPLNFTLRPVQAAKEGQPTTSIKRPRKFGEVDE